MAQGFQNNVDSRTVVEELTHQVATVATATREKLRYLNGKLIQDEEKIAEVDEKVDDNTVKLEELKNEIKTINSPDYEYDNYPEKEIYAIQPKKHEPFYRIHADRADRDNRGRNIVETYVAKLDTVSSTKDMYKEENKSKVAQAQAITGMMSVSGHQLILGYQGD